MNFTESNRLIAEFMGMNCHDNDKNLFVFNTKDGNDVISIHELKYHSDWNWLMNVVDKIESFTDEMDNNYKVTIENESCYIENTNILSSLDCKSKIDAVYQSVVEFIKMLRP